MRKSPTIYDVARRAGVSKSLVSLVLRGSPRVSDEKRAAVLTAVDELHYTPSRLAAGLAGTRTRGIGVVIDEFENLWFAPALAGLRAALAEGGYSLSVADRDLNAHLGLDPIEVFRSLRVDGLVLAGEAPADAVARLRVPAVVLGTRELAVPGAPVIASDERAGGRLATAHLADLGHRRIVCVSAPGASAGAREAGYRDEMAARGLPAEVIRSERTTEAAARGVAAGLFGDAAGAGADAGSGSPGASTGDRPTAVFAVNDPMAVGVIGAARARGLSVPGDLSVVGYDDSPLADYALVSLTTVTGDPHELGEAAGRALVALLEAADADHGPGVDPGSASRPAPAALGSAAPADLTAVDPAPGSPRLFPPRLVVRGSTASFAG